MNLEETCGPQALFMCCQGDGSMCYQGIPWALRCHQKSFGCHHGWEGLGWPSDSLAFTWKAISCVFESWNLFYAISCVIDLPFC